MAKLVKCFQHRVADVRLIAKWLHVGVLERSGLTQSHWAMLQGGSVRQLLFTIRLHQAFDVRLEPFPMMRLWVVLYRAIFPQVPVLAVSGESRVCAREHLHLGAALAADA
ncbi:MAG: hypothetical protein EBY24_10525 [Betaproteobacteria bacterium]|nr:hypothetical protein [Betaproteobacteria bacterium]